MRPNGCELTRMARVAGGAAAALWLTAGPAAAHAGEGGFVLLLPTGYYMLGGALAVAVSFALLALVPAGRLESLAQARLRLFGLARDWRTLTSLLSLLFLLALLWAAIWGSDDPLDNPLPLAVWTLFWVGLTLLEGLVGDFWRWLDPWYGIWRLVTAALGLSPDAPPWRLPEWLGRAPAIVVFYGFAWFELVDPAPADPELLARVVGLYWLANFAGMLLFGHRRWTRQVECFSVFFGFISRLAVFQREPGDDGKPALVLRVPGAAAAEGEAAGLSGVLFLLMALASVSFDGLIAHLRLARACSASTRWSFPAARRSSGSRHARPAGHVRGAGGRLPGSRWRSASGWPAAATAWRVAAGRLIWSILPISLAYHFAHYLTALLVNWQYALVALSDPLAKGWDLFGTAGLHVLAGVRAGLTSPPGRSGTRRPPRSSAATCWRC